MNLDLSHGDREGDEVVEDGHGVGDVDHFLIPHNLGYEVPPTQIVRNRHPHSKTNKQTTIEGGSKKWVRQARDLRMRRLE